MDGLWLQLQIMGEAFLLTLKILGPALLILHGPRLWRRFMSKRGVQQQSTATPAPEPGRTEPDHTG